MYRVLIKGWRGDASSLGRDERVLERKQRVFEVGLEERNLMLKATHKAWESEKLPLEWWDLRPEEMRSSVSGWRPGKLARAHRGKDSEPGQVGPQTTWQRLP